MGVNWPVPVITLGAWFWEEIPAVELHLLSKITRAAEENWGSQWRIQNFPDGGRQPLSFGQKPSIWQDFLPKTTWRDAEYKLWRLRYIYS